MPAQPTTALPVLTAESVFIGTMQGNLVAECTTFGTNAFTAEARATELVKRANAFPGLVEALQNLVDRAHEPLYGDDSLWDSISKPLEEAQSLLSSLKQS